MADTYPQQTSGATTTGNDTYYQQTSGTGKNTSGPHKSDFMNKLDPRVDSKKTHEYHDVATAESGMPGKTTTTGTPHGMGADGGKSGVTPTTGAYDSRPSAMEKQAQPQGTFDHRGAAGGGSQAVGGGTIPHTTRHTTDPNKPLPDSTGRTTGGPHHSGVANKVDPRVESDVNQRYYAGAGPGAGAGAGAGTGQAPMPSMINQGDSRVQDGGRAGLTHQQPVGGGGIDPRVQDGGGLTHQQPVGGGGIDPRAQDGGVGGLAHQQPVGNGGMPGMAGHGGATTMQPEAYQGGTYGTNTGGTYPDTHHTVTGGTHGGGVLPPEQHDGTRTHQGTSNGPSVTQGVKAAAAGMHGAGETLRGTLAGKVDHSLGSRSGAAKNDAVANDGMREIETGEFSNTTRAKEGARPREY